MLAPLSTWIGPTTAAQPVRRTREVLLELIRLAERRLAVVRFAAECVPEVLAELSMAIGRGVEVRLVLESAEASRGRLTHDAAAAFASLGTTAGFYVWPTEQRTSAEGVLGTLHAKGAIADAQAAFVTSANLTGHALTANMELGLLVRGGSVPARLTAHVDALIAQRTLRRIPA
jgi:phosphatidylserine/phosphatidylglycerophosphate/cardiolipin synthase-like enzyme